MKKELTREESSAIKGVAILLMIFHHCFRTEKKFAAYSPIFTAFFTESRVISLAKWAKICVPLFAFVSGYGLLYGYRKLKGKEKREEISSWERKHLISTMSGYWFVAVLSYILMALVGAVNFSKWGNTWLEKLINILADCMGISNLLGTRSLRGAWWYMGAAVFFIVILPVMAYCLKKAGGGLCVMFLFLLPRVLGLGYMGGRNAYSFLMIFLFGMMAYEYRVFERFHNLQFGKSKKASDIQKFLLLFLLVLAGVWSYGKVSVKLIWEYHYALIPFVLILFLEEFAFRITWIRKIAAFLGRYSLYIWLLHTFVRDYLGKYVWSVGYFWLVPIEILLLSLIMGMILDVFRKVSGYDKLIKRLEGEK